jgi:hypothetical protein
VLAKRILACHAETVVHHGLHAPQIGAVDGFDFIIAAAKMYGDAMVNSEPKMPEIVDLYAKVSRMRVLTMPRSVICAEKVMGSIVETYFAPNRTVADLREIVKTGRGVDPLKDISEAAREELRPFAPI